MADELRPPASGPQDHVSEGYRAAEELGLTGKEFLWSASLGRDRGGEVQVLVLGAQCAWLASRDGGSMTEIHRPDIRSVDAVPGEGLILRAQGRRWVHIVSDVDAVYLREQFIETPILPPTGSGGQCIPEMHWRHDQMANLVGLVVMRAAEAEHMLSLVACQSQQQSLKSNAFGRSGKQLSQHLGKAAASSPAIADMLERYEAWSKHRNQLVHSIRPMERGQPGPSTALPNINRQKDSPPEEIYRVQKQDLPELVDLWYAFNWLYHDAWHAYFRLTTGMPLKDLPLPSSVSGRRRLPP